MKWRLWDKCKEAEEFMFFHGLVNRYYWREESLTVVVPFNIVARFFLSIFHALRFPAELWWERKERCKK